MKHLGSAALISLLVSSLSLSLSLLGCENSSRLDETVKRTDQKGEALETAQATDHSGTLEERVARLEKNFDNYADALEFLQKIFEQQDREPDPNAVFAVNIAPNVQLGMVEGSPNAPVTIIEAWDFA